MAEDIVKKANRQIRYWQKLLEKELAKRAVDAVNAVNAVDAKENEKEGKEKNPPHPLKEIKGEKEKEVCVSNRVRAREIVFPKHATVLDVPPDDILVEPQPGQIKRDEPPNFFDLFCWVRRHLRLDHQRDKDVVDWWNAKIDDGWLDMQGNPLKNWTCHLRVWLDEIAKERNAEKLKSQRQSSNTNNINSGLRLRGGTFSPKILEKMKALEYGIE